jgi:GNAT superfamily N-acetyltransferase
MTDWHIRPGQDADGPGIIALITTCWSAYPGLHLDVDGELPQLHALATNYENLGGALWIAEADGRIVGMIAVQQEQRTIWEICQVYVDPPLHGSGLGHGLLDRAERYAIEGGAATLHLWSDTRFARAHRFYEKRSYVRRGPVRVLNDLSNSLEFGYAKPVNGVETLDIAAANSAEGRLAEILASCVNGGATVSFLPPMSLAKGRAFWHRAASEAAAGRRVIVAGWRDGVLVATGMLDLDLAENQPHVAEAQKIMVLPSVRRSGMAGGILRALERAAVLAGRGLLVLDTRAGDSGEMLYRAAGWQEYGRIPGHAVDGARLPIETVFFFKRIG